MAAPSVHHIGVGVSNENSAFKLFIDQLGFQNVAERVTNIDKKWVLKKDKILVVITVCNKDDNCSSAEQPRDEIVQKHSYCSKSSTSTSSNRGTNGDSNFCCNDKLSGIEDSDSYPHFTAFWNQPCAPNLEDAGNSTCQKLIDSVFEISLEVSDVKRTFENAVSNGAAVIRPVTTITAAEGTVTYAIIRSCVGNVVHTLINSANYHGTFLPGFTPTNDLTTNGIESSLGILHVDHITFCVPPGKTFETVQWYSDCFGMHRLLVNKDESSTNGLVLSDIGLRMAAMEYWKCAESGLALSKDKTSVKFVIAESLEASPNQVTTFLNQHGGPGVQHIGLLTNQLVDVVSHLKTVKLPFLQPPKQYYDEVGKLQEIIDCGESVELLEKCGVLLDSEADGLEESTNDVMSRYLMQVFTKPIFKEETFFLEFLQRHGATGFGAGNISALWRAVRLYMEQQGYH